MRTVFTTIVLTAVLAVTSVAYAAVPQTATAKKSAAPAATAKAATAASHSVKGVVKSIDASSLVITKSGKAGGDMTFTLNADTKRDGAPAVGSPVSVRYRGDGGSMVATAVTAQPAKAAKTQAKK
jgi:hypothetical protein